MLAWLIRERPDAVKVTAFQETFEIKGLIMWYHITTY